MNNYNRWHNLPALGLIAFHFLMVALHSVAHEILSVKTTQAQLAFIIPVIILAPLIAGLILQKFNKAATTVLLVSMLGSLLFGLYYHFVANTVDHVAHVAHLEPAFWSMLFRVTAYLLLASEALGTVFAGLLLVNWSPPFKHHAA